MGTGSIQMHVFVEDGVKWALSTPITKVVGLEKYTVEIGSKQILSIKSKPTGQDDCFEPITKDCIIYKNSVTESVMPSQTI